MKVAEFDQRDEWKNFTLDHNYNNNQEDHKSESQSP